VSLDSEVSSLRTDGVSLGMRKPLVCWRW